MFIIIYLIGFFLSVLVGRYSFIRVEKELNREFSNLDYLCIVSVSLLSWIGILLFLLIIFIEIITSKIIK